MIADLVHLWSIEEQRRLSDGLSYWPMLDSSSGRRLVLLLIFVSCAFLV